MLWSGASMALGALGEPWRAELYYIGHVDARAALQLQLGARHRALRRLAPTCRPGGSWLPNQIPMGRDSLPPTLASVKDRHSLQTRASRRVQCTGGQQPRLAAHHTAPHQPGAAKPSCRAMQCTHAGADPAPGRAKPWRCRGCWQGARARPARHAGGHGGQEKE